MKTNDDAIVAAMAGAVSHQYILDDQGNAKPARDLAEWSLWMESAHKSGKAVVGETRMRDENDEEVRVSTVFLGLDHGFDGGPPILFELMIFGGRHSEYQRRFATMKEARAWHLLVTKSTLWEIEAAKKARIVEAEKPWKRNLIV